MHSSKAAFCSWWVVISFIPRMIRYFSKSFGIAPKAPTTIGQFFLFSAIGTPFQFANLYFVIFSCFFSSILVSPWIVTSTIQTSVFKQLSNPGFCSLGVHLFEYKNPAKFHENIILFAEALMHHCYNFIVPFQICLQDFLTAAYQVIHCFLCFHAQSALAVMIRFPHSRS